MKRKRIVGIGSVLLALFLLCLFRTPVCFANSAPVHWYGTDGAGVYATEGRCPLQVQSERLTFDLPVFPKTDLEADPHYGGSVTADYLFYNPTDQTIAATLAFPVGPLPSYYYDYSDESSSRVFPPESFGVTADGKSISCETRYTYLSTDALFDAQTQLRMFSSGLESTALLTPETTLTVFAFRVEELPENHEAWITVKPDTETVPDGVGTVLTDDRWMSTEGVGMYVKNGELFYLICFGEVSSTPTFSFYDSKTNIRLPSGRMAPQEKETMTLEAFFDRQTDNLTGVERTDRYNAAVCSLDHWLREDDRDYFDFTFSLADELTPWCVYSLTVAPGETLENKVTEPIYPEVDVNLLPASYNYTYYWSPAALWADFGTLDVEIRTPFALRACMPDEAEKTKDGYALHFDGLPAGELRFTLGKTRFLKLNKSAIVAAAVFSLAFGLPVFGIVFVIVRSIKRKKRKQEG